MKTIISPSILSADLKNLAAQVWAAQEGGADEIHIDVMDGRFVPNITFGSDIVRACKDSTDLPIDVHLMIVEPEKHLKSFIDAGANTVTIHYETCPHIHRSLQTIRELGARAGLTYNPGTPVDSLTYLADVVDQVLIMSVNPGFGGQKFIPSALEKIDLVRWILDEHTSDAIIQVDGGISTETIRDAYEAGARSFVAGTAVFGHLEGIAAGIAALRAALD
ncbi:MAG: ribulose-phosphate 3-epimerase [Anaerolineaceae bacterium]|jgi:ribulose-phosphate 3-epimerase|nr:ribulose-phosphate 3-epimerase [Anaerolineaceae bacterium]MDD4042419.1 ribulose-phosphate 3-epimerase [Anaerolineaceae bacterium]MDD4578040.1 ribulose-phosphate 3-epimerase [Anaerolineaceae bacterium]